MTWPEAHDALREPFPKGQIGRIPASKGRPALDFVGHAAVTDRLNRYAPDWTYTVDEVVTINGSCWIRGTMTIGGVSRVEYGDGDNPKEAIGNFIRRAAMRFGVAIDLWSREELGANVTAAGAEDVRETSEASASTPTPGTAAAPARPSAKKPVEQDASGTGAGGESPPVSRTEALRRVELYRELEAVAKAQDYHPAAVLAASSGRSVKPADAPHASPEEMEAALEWLDRERRKFAAKAAAK